MRNLKLILMLVFNAFLLGLNAQIFTEKDLPFLVEKSKKDSIFKIERKAALAFHKRINSYRKKHQLKVLEWDEALWIASRNHNVWMSKTNKLSHFQSVRNKYFTGKNPQDRFKFVVDKSTSTRWSAENALYNYSYYGDNITEIAQNMAEKSFNQWKNSTDHNKNMLGKNHLTHGVSFLIRDDLVWGTDLFSPSKRKK
ncbi:MAG: CAP domain-containing protein [Vicingaceae bacterium]